METIKIYLDNMFMSLPNTDEVIKAKAELLSMMEDKYEELRSEGKTDNEAIGIVISEFGNLDEVAESLGISDEVTAENRDNREMLPLQRAKDYIANQAHKGNLVALGVFMCIASMIGPIFCSNNITAIGETIGISAMFLMIAAGVILFIVAGSRNSNFKDIEKNQVVIGVETADFVKNERDAFHPSHVLMLALGVGLCIVSVIPMIITEAFLKSFSETFAPALMFLFVGIGVLLIVASSYRDGSYETLLRLNGNETMAGEFIKDKNEKNTIIGKIKSVYWSTVLCIFLIVGFLTFRWGMAGRIWIWGVIGYIALSIVDGIINKED